MEYTIVEHTFDTEFPSPNPEDRELNGRRYCGSVSFHGQIWFDFAAPSVWVFYRWIRILAESGVDVALEWIPLIDDADADDSQVAAAATLLGLDREGDRGRFIHAMFGLVHGEGRSPSDVATVTAALTAAQIDPSALRRDHPTLRDLAVQSDDLGIDAVPSLVRHGPALSIQLNPSVLDEDPGRVAQVIADVLACDGIWELRKP